MNDMKKRLFALLTAPAMLLPAGCGGGQAAASQQPDTPAPSEEVTPARPDTVQTDTAPSVDPQPEVQEPTDNPQPESEPAEIRRSEFPEAASATEPEADPEPASEPEPAETLPEDGTYTASVTLEGGSGRATVQSPAALRCEDGKFYATIVWSSPNFDYMKVNGEKYLQTSTEGNSTFEIPVAAFDRKLDVIADTVAMSEPHEVEYTLTFDSATLQRQ